MDKIQKVLSKLSAQEKEKIKDVLLLIKAKNLHGLDVKKLKGFDNIFRVRKGQLRILFRIENNQTYILKIERRNDNTYDI